MLAGTKEGKDKIVNKAAADKFWHQSEEGKDVNNFYSLLYIYDVGISSTLEKIFQTEGLKWVQHNIWRTVHLVPII